MDDLCSHENRLSPRLNATVGAYARYDSFVCTQTLLVPGERDAAHPIIIVIIVIVKRTIYYRVNYASYRELQRHNMYICICLIFFYETGTGDRVSVCVYIHRMS